MAIARNAFESRKGSLRGAAILIVCLTIAAYANSFRAEFQLDDTRLIRNLSSASTMGDGPIAWALSGTRPLVRLTFALNYLAAGRNVVPYHAVNVAVHLANGLLVYVLVLLLMGSHALQNSTRRRGREVALLVSGLFLLHPLQTQAVTYISQRYESVASLFYLCTVVAYAAAGTSRTVQKKAAWLTACGLSYAAGLASKEIAVTVPVALLLYDLAFMPVGGRVKRLVVPGVMLAASVAAGVSVLVKQMGVQGASAGFGALGISPGEYLMTQFRALVTYLRLLLLPVNQNLDYGYRLSRSFLEWDTALAFIFVLCLFGVTVFLWRRWRPGSLGILWFLLVLVPTSTVVPVADLVNEHRVYLASTGVFILAGGVLGHLVSQRAPVRRAATAGTAVLLVVLAVATFQRNTVWRTQVSLWTDVVKKTPGKARVYYALGNAHREAGHMQEALRAYETAVLLNPGHSAALNNVANIYLTEGRLEEARITYEKAVQADPMNFEAVYNLGSILLRLGRPEQAAVHLGAFVRHAPSLLYGPQKEQVRRLLERKGLPEDEPSR